MKKRSSKCKFCGVPIRFVRLPSRQWIAINPRPNKAGTVVANTINHYACYANGQTPKVLPSGIHRYVSHHETCPHDVAIAGGYGAVVGVDSAQAVAVDGKAAAAGERQEDDQ